MALSYNDWYTTNIADRLIDLNTDFKIELNLTPCQRMTFHDAADYTAKLIPYKKKFIAFSGGADSEYVIRTFKRNNIEITPIIINSTINDTETKNALSVCLELRLTPVLISINEDILMREYLSNIYQKLNGVGIWSTFTYLAAIYAAEKQGVLITGDHMMDDNTCLGQIYVSEYDTFYNDILVPNTTLPFYNYTIELTRSMASLDENFELHKCKIYNLRERPKSKYKLPPQYQKYLDYILKNKIANHQCEPMSKQQLLDRC